MWSTTFSRPFTRILHTAIYTTMYIQNLVFNTIAIQTPNRSFLLMISDAALRRNSGATTFISFVWIRGLQLDFNPSRDWKQFGKL
ncbi:hypothetical protein BDZ94DRAFT_1257538 [Collybia nuda]|uniref:Uncharacterized protein n=1 Tax=Collybia nuda TaxID=64659 RepID=A0A9P5Y692_9AGAR|nr:hypothetical protein BDZ94DRAFT_1257538 [Collybia nuda]